MYAINLKATSNKTKQRFMVSNLTVGDKMKQKILNSKESKKGKERTKDR